MSAATEASETTGHPGSALEVLRVFTKLGFTSFGGPIAHLGFFRTEFVARRGWLDEDHYADVVALSQFLPGPASSKVGIIVGVLRAGIPGALAAWIGFTLPSALALILFGYGVTAFGNLGGATWLHGLKIVAVAVVAQAVWGMARNLCPDRERATIAVAAAALALAVPSTLGQVGAIVAGGLIGWWFLAGEVVALIPLPVRISRWWSITSIVLFFGILIGLPFVVAATGSHLLAVFDGFYRSGSLVFAGLGRQRHVPRRLRRGPGGAGTVVHLFGLSRNRHGAGTEWLARGAGLSRGDFPAVVLSGDRSAAVLELVSPASGDAFGVEGRQRRRSRVAARGALQPGLDQRDPRASRFRDRDHRLSHARDVGGAALAGRHSRRAGGHRRRHGRIMALDARRHGRAASQDLRCPPLP